MQAKVQVTGGFALVVLLLLCFMGLLKLPEARLYPDSPVGEYKEAPLTEQEQYAWNTLTNDGSHAETLHEDEYELVRSCPAKWKLEIRPSKYIDVCQISEDMFGFRPFKQIGGNIEKGNATFQELTAYIRYEIRSVDDLVRLAEQLKVKLIAY